MGVFCFLNFLGCLLVTSKELIFNKFLLFGVLLTVSNHLQVFLTKAYSSMALVWRASWHMKAMFCLLSVSWLIAMLLVEIGLKYLLESITRHPKACPIANWSLIACILMRGRPSYLFRKRLQWPFFPHNYCSSWWNSFLNHCSQVFRID